MPHQRRDLHSVFTKVRYVLLPIPDDTKVKELLDWDLLGPLLISVGLLVIMMLKGSSSYEALFGSVFFLIVFGSLLVTLNAKLIGLKFSGFFYVAVLGYCLTPMLIAALVNLLLGRFITRFGVLLVALACFAWCVRSASTFFYLTVDKSKPCMVMYPVILFYLFFAGFIILN